MPSHFQRMRLHDSALLVFSAFIGLLAALGAIVFRSLIELFQTLFWGAGPFAQQTAHAPWWLLLLIPALGGLAAGPMIAFWAPEAKGPGVSEVIMALARGHCTIRHRVTALKSLITSLLIGTGASVGREGPIVQIGASAGSSLAQLFHLKPELRRVCLASGAAAGISATFNAPIAGTLFALEIILLDIHIGNISNIVIASVTASVLSRAFWGEFPALSAQGFSLAHSWELAFHFLLGILAGFAAILFLRAISTADTAFTKLPLPDWLKPCLGGVILGLMALFLPQILGVGYPAANLALAGKITLGLALAILIGKLLATALCIGSGMSGGIFAPSLLLGGVLGSSMALFANQLFPSLALAPQHYALAGMGAFVAGATLAPITAILTIFELTYSYQIILPLMLGCVTSATVVRMFFGYSAYEMKLLKQGVDLVRGHEAGILKSIQVREIMNERVERLSQDTPLLDIVTRVIESPFPHFIVEDANGDLTGVLSLRDVRPCLGQVDLLAPIIIAHDLMTHSPITLPAPATLEQAFHIFEQSPISMIPITHTANPKKAVGQITRTDVMHAYSERALKNRTLSCPLDI